ncbi:MAG: GIY-YIG nuclease family protein [Candidatus Marinimicrobia bacterium]|nr:GIY-YIG nuclease family protein [Candidatus Neomarinimicrobiota bacterium]
MARTFYTYIMASKTRVLYIGMTNDLFRRVWEHKRHLLKGFTKRFNPPSRTTTADEKGRLNSPLLAAE